MALIKYGGGVIQMSGSIAGNTFARNRYGNYVRSRTKPVNPNTGRQDVIRAAMAELTDRWSQVLTANKRTAWNLYGSKVAMKNKLGESVFLTGFNHYIRSNMNRTQFGFGTIDDGPVVFELPAQDTKFAASAHEDVQNVEFTIDDGLAWCSEDGAFFFWYQGTPQNPQRNFFAGPWRKEAWQVGQIGVPITSPQTWPAVYAMSLGQHLWFYGRIQRADGRLSEKFRCDTFCEA